MSRDEVISQNPIADFVRDRGHDLKRAGGNFVTSGCPVTVHKKYHRPVSIDIQKQVWHCNDCKVGGSVIDWVSKEKGISGADAMRELGGGRNNSEPHGKIVARYDYTDESGNLLYQTCRYQPKDFRQRRPDGKGGWIWNLDGAPRVLYRLPEVRKAQTVSLTEGEKDCDNLEKLGFVATTNPLGAGKWRDEYSETLRGKEVIVFGDVGDDDGAGEKHTQEVIESLTGKAKSIKHVALPGGFHDVSDYIASLPHGTVRDTIRKLIDETPEVEAHSLGVTKPEPVKLPPPQPPYVPPPLNLLPGVLQDYVHEAAESLNVDVSFILLPLLSALGSAIGNTRSIFLKRGFVQPPVIWTTIVGRSGSRKSPALEKATFSVMEHERELVRQNKVEAETYAESLAQWESKSRTERGLKPEPPLSLTCLMDDMTLEALADAMQENPRGVLVKKDELSHWFASFDQYHASKGADVSRWLSLHTGVFFGLDRRTDKRRYRIHQPRVCVTGGIQPKVLARVLTEDFFERGLPARFLSAYPPMGQDKWSEVEVSNDRHARVLELFEELWLLQPERDEHDQPRPKLLNLDSDAQAEYVRYYNECGAFAVQADEHEEAAWCKLSGYAARLALVGQLASDPHAETVTGETMRAACDLARWFGNEAVRIYASLSETPEQQKLRKLIEFIEARGGRVRIRDLMQSYTSLKNKRKEAEAQLNDLVKAGYGKWVEVPTTPRGGKPTREFELLRSSTSTEPHYSRGKAGGIVDVDSSSTLKNEASGESEPDPEKESPAGSVSVPLMMTKQMESDLLKMGYSQAEIDKMAPGEAWEKLGARRACPEAVGGIMEL